MQEHELSYESTPQNISRIDQIQQRPPVYYAMCAGSFYYRLAADRQEYSFAKGLFFFIFYYYFVIKFIL